MKRGIYDRLRTEYPATTEVSTRFTTSLYLGAISFAGLGVIGLVAGSSNMSDGEMLLTTGGSVAALSTARVVERRKTANTIEDYIYAAADTRIADMAAQGAGDVGAYSVKCKVEDQLYNLHVRSNSDPRLDSPFIVFSGLSNFIGSVGFSSAIETQSISKGLVGAGFALISLKLGVENYERWRERVTDSMMQANYLDSKQLEVLPPGSSEMQVKFAMTDRILDTAAHIQSIRRGES